MVALLRAGIPHGDRQGPSPHRGWAKGGSRATLGGEGRKPQGKVEILSHRELAGSATELHFSFSVFLKISPA